METSPYQIECNDTDDCSGHYTCLPNGQKDCLERWTGEDCTDLEDTPTLCTNGGRSCLNGGTCWADQSECCCPAGFTGEVCQLLESHCDSLPCQNGAVCHNFVSQYACECINGKNCI